MGFIDDFDGVGKRWKLRIFFELSRRDCVWVNEITSMNLGAPRTVYNRLRDLEREGLVVIGEPSHTFPFEKRVELTDMGRTVVSKLVDIENYYIEMGRTSVPPQREPRQRRRVTQEVEEIEFSSNILEEIDGIDEIVSMSPRLIIPPPRSPPEQQVMDFNREYSEITSFESRSDEPPKDDDKEEEKQRDLASRWLE